MSRLRGDGDVVSLHKGTAASSIQAAFTVSVIDVPGGSAINGTYFTFSTDRNDYYVWFNVTDAAGAVGNPSDPTPGGVGIPVSLTTAIASNAIQTASRIAVQLKKLSDISVAQAAASVVVTVTEFGDVTDAVGDDASSFLVTIDASGVARPEVTAKFLQRTVSGSVVAIVGEEGSTWNVANSAAQVYDPQRLNLFGSATISSELGASSATHAKTDNRPGEPVV